MNRSDALKLVLSLIVPQLAGAIGAAFTMNSITGWYATLVKPAFTPPNWLFFPAWETLYLLMGVSLFLVWRRGIGKRGVNQSILAFGGQLALNVLWSVIFFGLHQTFYGFIEIIILWAAIAITIIKSFRVSKSSAYVLIPYIAWVTFAMTLNFYVWRLN